MKKQFGCVAAFVLLMGAAPQATPSPAPVATPAGADGIKITNCNLRYNQLSGVPGKFHVDFVNMNALPVTHIRFRVLTNGGAFAVMDIGLFAPNVPIHHDLDPPNTPMRVIGGITGGGITGLDCTVDAYTLTDGSTWISDSLRLELQTQTPHP